MQAQIAFLQGERKGQENLKKDLVRRIKMLEYALKQERYAALVMGTWWRVLNTDTSFAFVLDKNKMCFFCICSVLKLINLVILNKHFDINVYIMVKPIASTAWLKKYANKTLDWSMMNTFSLVKLHLLVQIILQNYSVFSFCSKY